MPLSGSYLTAIQKFEGFTQQATWDYAQYTNGYGTRAKSASETITEAEAQRRFRAEIGEARALVERFAPDIDDGTKSALTSLTFNAGTKWMKSGLGQAVHRGDLDAVREIFVQYNKAGGKVLPGLVARRAAEVAWIGAPVAGSNQTEVAAALPSAGKMMTDNAVSPKTAAPFTAGYGLASSAVRSEASTEFLIRMTLEVLELLARSDAGATAPSDDPEVSQT